jgi:hypothetical protein
MPVIRRKYKTFSYSRGMGLINRTKKTRRPKSRHVQRGHRCWLHPTPIHTHLDYLSTGYGYGHGPVAIDATAAVPRQPFHPARTRGRRETAIHLCIHDRRRVVGCARWPLGSAHPRRSNSQVPRRGTAVPQSLPVPKRRLDAAYDVITHTLASLEPEHLLVSAGWVGPHSIPFPNMARSGVGHLALQHRLCVRTHVPTKCQRTVE